MNTTQIIKAIPTKYNGIQFRSRLEARWAVFFEAAGIKWEYEKEGYVLQSGECYLPDFLVLSPEFGPLFIEIKPNRQLEPQEISKCEQISTKHKTLMIHGAPYIDIPSGCIDAPFSFFCSGSLHDKIGTLAGWLDIDRDRFPLECFTEARFEHGQAPNTTRPVQFIQIAEVDEYCPPEHQAKSASPATLARIADFVELWREMEENPPPPWFPGMRSHLSSGDSLRDVDAEGEASLQVGEQLIRVPVGNEGKTIKVSVSKELLKRRQILSLADCITLLVSELESCSKVEAWEMLCQLDHLLDVAGVYTEHRECVAHYQDRFDQMHGKKQEPA